ncbi:hypothetical protein HYS48_03460, partial [Candidatus Woesearchaeota archaeon]|nr:hypothetical protein [Candidatus Woesearchaeota archaeon]
VEGGTLEQLARETGDAEILRFVQEGRFGNLPHEKKMEVTKVLQRRWRAEDYDTVVSPSSVIYSPSFLDRGKSGEVIGGFHTHPSRPGEESILGRIPSTTDILKSIREGKPGDVSIVIGREEALTYVHDDTLRMYEDFFTALSERRLTEFWSIPKAVDFLEAIKESNILPVESRQAVTEALDQWSKRNVPDFMLIEYAEDVFGQLSVRHSYSYMRAMEEGVDPAIFFNTYGTPELVRQAIPSKAYLDTARMMEAVEHADDLFRGGMARHIDDLDPVEVAALNERYGLWMEIDAESRVVYATEQERQFLEAIGIDTSPKGFAPGAGTVGAAQAAALEIQPAAFPFTLPEGYADDALKHLDDLLGRQKVADTFTDIQKKASQRVEETQKEFQKIDSLTEEDEQSYIHTVRADPEAKERISEIAFALTETPTVVKDILKINIVMKDIPAEQQGHFLAFFKSLQEQNLPFEQKVTEALIATETMQRLSPEDARLFSYLYNTQHFGNTRGTLQTMQSDGAQVFVKGEVERLLRQDPTVRLILDAEGNIDHGRTFNEFLAFRRVFRTEDGGEIPAQLSTKFDALFQFAREQGVEISLGGGDARRALTGKNPTPFGSDVDVLIPSERILLEKGINPAKFNQRVEEILHGLEFEYIGEGGKYHTILETGGPDFTINMLQIRSDGTVIGPPDFVKDLTANNGNPLIRLSEPPKKPLALKQPLRAIRLLSEYPNAAMDQETEKILKERITQILREHNIFAGDLSGEYTPEAAAGYTRILMGENWDTSYHVKKIFLNSRDGERTLSLLREFNLYYFLTGLGADLETLAKYPSTKDEAYLVEGLKNYGKRYG